MGYQGIERRRHFVYVTRNTEYHLRDGVCVAVRDRRSGRFLRAHIAEGLPMAGGVRLFARGSVIPRVERPDVGDALCFMQMRGGEVERQIVTTRIEAITRPPKDVVARYPA